MSQPDLHNGLYKIGADGLRYNVYDGMIHPDDALSVDENYDASADNASDEIESDHLYAEENADFNDYYGDRSNRLEREAKEREQNRAKSKSNRNTNWYNFSNLRLKKRLKPEEKIGGTLRYPYEALTDQTDYLQFDIKQYVPLGMNSLVRAPGDDKRYVKGGNDVGSTLPQDLSRTSRAVINDGTILLPIPAQIQDSNSVSYGDSSLNGLQAAGITAAGGLQNNLADAIGDGLTKEAWENLRNDVTSTVMDFGRTAMGGIGGQEVASDMLLKYFSAQAVSALGGNVTFNEVLARAEGEIMNPNMELLFNGPTLRAFKFSFKMTPRNPMEANQCGLIIRAFKRNMAVKAQGTSQSGSWFLKTPNVFNLRYRSGNKDHPFLHKFKQCFLTDCSVNYTADGVYATYEDATPTAMILDLSFKELEPIYDLDYDEEPGRKAVGY